MHDVIIRSVRTPPEPIAVCIISLSAAEANPVQPPAATRLASSEWGCCGPGAGPFRGLYKQALNCEKEALRRYLNIFCRQFLFAKR